MTLMGVNKMITSWELKGSLEMAQTWGIKSNFKQKRLHRVKKHFDELSQDEKNGDNEKRI